MRFGRQVSRPYRNLQSTFILWVGLLIVALAMPGNSPATSRIIEMPLPPGVLSKDGKIAAGTWHFLAWDGDMYEAQIDLFSWSEENGFTIIPGDGSHNTNVTGINFDGSTIVGWWIPWWGGMDEYFPSPMRWTEANGWQYLYPPSIPQALAYDVSNDGSVVVGVDGIRGDPWGDIFIWRESTGREFLGLPLNQSPDECWVEDTIISGDGRTVVVDCNSYDSTENRRFYTFYKWTDPLGYVPLGSGRPVDLSTDGSIIVGVSDDGQAFRYSDADGMRIIGQFVPVAANADCSVIAGRHVIWDEMSGVQPIADYLESKGIDLETDGWVLESVADISDDGNVIVGSGYNQNGIIIDNLDPQFSSGPEAWPGSRFIPGGYNDFYQYAAPGDGNRWASWTHDLPFYGSYDIYARWTAQNNRATDATYSFVDSSVQVDQTQNGGRFSYLGTYEMTPHYHSNGISIKLTDTQSGYVVADAVKVVSRNRGWMAKLDPPSAEMIVDNHDAGFASGPGQWPWSQYTPGGYNETYQYQPPGTGDKWAGWTFQLSSPGNYEIFAQWTASGNRSTAAPYTIANNGTTIGTFAADQTRDGGRFVSLGSYSLAAGTVEVVLNDIPTGYVIADAVKVVPEGVAPQ